MPGMDGVEATRRIRASYPAAAIVAFCSEHSPEVRDAFLLAGANGFVDKRDVRKLIAAVRDVAESRTDPQADTANALPPRWQSSSPPPPSFLPGAVAGCPGVRY
jgi:DNA-binding NarL/FixJ family response regulator